jgi:hypothetical protein
VNPARYPMHLYHPQAFSGQAPAPPRIVFVSIQPGTPPPVMFASGPMEMLHAAMMAGLHPQGAWLEMAQTPEGPAGFAPSQPPRPARRPPADIADAEFIDLPQPQGHSQPQRVSVEPMLPAAMVRQLAFGEFRRLIEPQLRHPESLSDAALITCAIQVYSAPHPLQPAQLAGAVFARTQPEGHFTILTRSLAERLQLASRLPPRPNSTAIRYLHLIVLDDPTAAQRAASPPPPREQRTAIPERYLKPWEFRLSREEVLYDMREERGRKGLGAVWSRLRRWLRSSSSLRRWQALLQGRTAEDQLWAVRPPACAFQHPEVRQWVSQLLAACGYQPEVMLEEWEIYWRRKALSSD